MRTTPRVTDEDCILYETLLTEESSQMPNGNRRLRPQIVLSQWCAANISKDDWFYVTACDTKAEVTKESFMHRMRSNAYLEKEAVYFGFKNKEDAVVFTLTFGNLFKIRQVKDNVFDYRAHE